VVKYTDRSAYYEAEAVALGDTMGERVEAKALARSVTNDFESYVKLNKRVPPEVVGVVRRIEDYAELADTHKEKKRSTTRFAPPSSARLRFQRLIVPPPLCRT
jgi:ATP-dependent Lon protease